MGLYFHIFRPLFDKYICFTLQDVVEERFRTEYLIAIVVAVVLLLIISLVVTTLLAMRCQRSRAKRLRAAAIESGKLHRSRSGGDLSNTDTTIATQVCLSIEGLRAQNLDFFGYNF